MLKLLLWNNLFTLLNHRDGMGSLSDSGIRFGTWTCGWIERIEGGKTCFPGLLIKLQFPCVTQSYTYLIQHIVWADVCGECEKGQRIVLLPLPKQTRGSCGNLCWVHSRKSDISGMWKQDSVPIYTHTYLPLERNLTLTDFSCGFGYSSLNECFL